MFTEEDKALHAGLMKLLNEATYPLKAREVKSFLAVYEWARNLPNKAEPKKVKRGRK